MGDKSMAVIQKTRAVLEQLKLEFSNIKVGYYSVSDEPRGEDIEYVIDKADDTEIMLGQIFDRILYLQERQSIRLGVIWLYMFREHQRLRTFYSKVLRETVWL